MTRRVLIVDDEPDLRLLVRLGLTRAGYDVIEADNGQEALDLLEHERPDAVLLDLRMPLVDGWEVLERLRSEGVLDNLKVIAVSAHASTGSMSRALELGAVAYLKKPFRVQDLRQVLDDVLGPAPE